MKYKNICLLITLLTFCSCNNGAPTSIGAKNGKITVCSSEHDCVSSIDSREDKNISPIKILSKNQFAYSKLLKVLESTSGIEIISKGENYIYAVSKSPILKFANDLEFLFDYSKKFIYIRGESRGSWFSSGSSRKIIEKIRFRYIQNDF